MFTAAFFDVDGTLQSFNTKSIPASAVKALGILRERGLKVFVATGRHKSELGKIRDAFEFDAYVTLNGQYCFDSDGCIIHKLGLDPDDVAVAVEQAGRRLYPCYFVEEHAKYVNYVDEKVREVCRLVGSADPEVQDPARALRGEVFQLCAYLPEAEEGVLMNHLKNADATRWHPSFIDVVPRGGSKQAGIDATLRHFGMANDGVIAFGDGENDVSMLAGAKVGVAMGNAGPEAKEAADYVTADVDDDGVLKAVIKYFG